MDKRITESESRFPHRQARIVLCRCDHGDAARNLFGMRIERRNKIWLRTWAFRISAEKAEHEGWSAKKITSSLNTDDGYNGCPYCGGLSLAQCSCGRMFCTGTKNLSAAAENVLKCPWCGQTGIYQTAEAFDVQGGGY